jgi:hypothetical protein
MPPASAAVAGQAEGMTSIRPLQVRPIPADVVADFRRTGRDGLGHPISTHTADGGEPLRCCLRRAVPGESIAVISYSPTPVPGPWQEYGPVFVHGHECEGRDASAGLPDELRTGPRVLRSYRRDGSLHYDAIVVVPTGADIDEPVRALVGREDVFEVHVRTLEPQCFLFAVRGLPSKA